MRVIKIYYNPYFESTRLFVDDIEHDHSGIRYDEFIVGKNIENWLVPYVISYHRWDGILCELMEALNDDELNIIFYSLPRFFPMVRTAFSEQISMVEERGYEANSYSLELKEYYLPERIIKNVDKFVQSIKHFLPDQYSMNLFDYVEQRMMETTDKDEKKAKDVYVLLTKLIESALQVSKNNNINFSYIPIWEKAEKELHRIYGGK